MAIRVELVVDHRVRQLCRQPYPLHPKGCPNFGKRATCPPQCPIIENVLDLTKPVWAIYNRFDFRGHVARMRAKHPEWSKRQVQCCLYWQGSARKLLGQNIALFRQNHLGLRVLRTPEACGVNITATMAAVGIELEWPPVNVTYQVALAGTSKEKTDE